MLQDFRPDLILMDVILPIMSGLQATRIIKSNPDFASIFVVNMSAVLTSEQNKESGLDSGADGYITRPISNQELLTSVNAYLSLKTMMDGLASSEERFRSIIGMFTRSAIRAKHSLYNYP